MSLLLLAYVCSSVTVNIETFPYFTDHSAFEITPHLKSIKKTDHSAQFVFLVMD